MRVNWDRAALKLLETSEPMQSMLHKAATKVRDQARANVQGHYPGTRRDRAIWVDSGIDATSAFATVGYDKSKPGWVLFYSEVGTLHMSPRPHLRRALDQVRF